jgi:DNA polymerase III subunit delta'
MSWDSIRGHDAPREQLAKAHELGRLAHAYLFVGPDGVGKRTFAIQLAKTLLCQAPPSHFCPCDKCQACQQVEAFTHPDFSIARLPDEKQELPVKLMREEFIPRLSLTASRGGWKIGFIEDADAFNEESANCFLKTLEEPPPKTLLILRSRTLERQLPTIRSRCQVVRFAPLNESDMRTVLAQHEIHEPSQLAKLLPLAGGSPGLALSLDDDVLWDTRSAMLTNLATTKPDSTQLAQDWLKAVEAVGKESRQQRERSSLILRLVIDGLREQLRTSIERDQPEQIDKWLQRIETCAEADLYLDRKAQISTMIDVVCDRLCQ